ncbi:MAG TPA: SDR family oxidoreductase [Bacteroidia bacterium]|nr:SDR family oxidoreductase [Bacteroidia bacterium]
MENTNKTNNKGYALITGGTSGIGFELAKLFAQDGYHLVIVARDEDKLKITAYELEKIGANVTLISKNLFRADSAQEVYDIVKAKGIHIDVLVNNAGHGHYGEFLYTSLEMEINIIQLNIISLITLTKLFLKDMVAKGEGKILNVSSIASKSPGPWQSVYHATKAFVQSFTEALRIEVKSWNINVTALLPGMTDTDFFNKANMNDSKALQDKRKLADPADVAKDGYEALMQGKDMIISGLKNKIEVAFRSITPDEKNAEKIAKSEEPVHKL